MQRCIDLWRIIEETVSLDDISGYAMATEFASIWDFFERKELASSG